MTFWNFLKVVHSGSEDGSAKRVYGGLIIIALLVILYFTAHKIIPLEIWDKIESTFQYIFTVGATLLGLNTAIDIFKVIKNGKDKEPKPPDKQP
jgi:hypothetical protein